MFTMLMLILKMLMLMLMLTKMMHKGGEKASCHKRMMMMIWELMTMLSNEEACLTQQIYKKKKSDIEDNVD